MPIHLFGTRSRRRAGCPTSPAAGARRLRAHRARGRARMRARRGPRARAAPTATWVDRRGQDFHHQRRAPTSPPRGDHGDDRRRTRSRTSSSRTARPASSLGRRMTSWAGMRRTRASSSFDDCRVPAANLLGAAGAGVPAVPADPRRRADLRRRDGRRARAGRLDLALAYAQSGSSSAGRSRRSRRSRSSSPTWPRRSRPRRTLVHKAAWLKDQGRPYALEAAMASSTRPSSPTASPMRRSRSTAATATWRSSRSRALLPRPEDPRDRRGHERGAAHGDRKHLGLPPS